MKNTFGNALTVTLFGESHGSAIGAVIDGIAPGIKIDTDYIETKMALRRPSGKISTARSEKDGLIFESGVYDGHTTGTPICILIKNADTHSSDYSALAGKARPGHADFRLSASITASRTQWAAVISAAESRRLSLPQEQSFRVHSGRRVL